MPQKYIDVVRPAIVDTLILGKCVEGNVTMEQVERDVRNAGIDLGNLNIKDRVNELQETGHLQVEGQRLRATDDGREDVRKALGWFQKVHDQVGTARTGMAR